MTTAPNHTHTCIYCWQQVINFSQHIGVECPRVPMECVFGCGDCIPRGEMVQHCQQCHSTTRTLSQQQQQQQQQHQFVVNCTPVEETAPTTDESHQ